MFSFGIELSRAFWIAAARVAFASGSGPPCLAATMIARDSFEKSWPRLASAAPFLCLMLDHLLWPDTRPHPPDDELHRPRPVAPSGHLPPPSRARGRAREPEGHPSARDGRR